MAITSTGAFGSNATLPTGYTNPTLPTISTPADRGVYTVDLAGTAANADPVVGAGNVISALETQFNATHAINVLKLDATATVTAALTITSIVRMNDGDDSSQFESGTEVYRCQVSYIYE
ncbi:MAG: hypothetical protein ACYS17_16520 [Planctomycetota bacterium]|jgi:hypothetical protein